MLEPYHLEHKEQHMKKFEYTFTVGEYDRFLNQSLDNKLHIAMSGTVDIMNELLVSEDVKFVLGANNNICLMDVASEEILKDIPQEEILHLAKEIGVLQSLSVH